MINPRSQLVSKGTHLCKKSTSISQLRTHLASLLAFNYVWKRSLIWTMVKNLSCSKGSCCAQKKTKDNFTSDWLPSESLSSYSARSILLAQRTKTMNKRPHPHALRWCRRWVGSHSKHSRKISRQPWDFSWMDKVSSPIFLRPFSPYLKLRVLNRKVSGTLR